MPLTMPICCNEPGQTETPLSIKYKTLEMRWEESQVIHLSAIPPDCAATLYQWKVESGPGRVSPVSGYETTLTIDTALTWQTFEGAEITVQLYCGSYLIDTILIIIQPRKVTWPEPEPEPEPEIPPEPEVPIEPDVPAPEVPDWLPKCCYEWNDASELIKIEANKNHILIPDEVKLSAPKIANACHNTCFIWRTAPTKYPVSTECGKKAVLRVEEHTMRYSNWPSIYYPYIRKTTGPVVVRRPESTAIEHFVHLFCAGELVATKKIISWFCAWSIFRSYMIQRSVIIHHRVSNTFDIVINTSAEITYYNCFGEELGRKRQRFTADMARNTWPGLVGRLEQISNVKEKAYMRKKGYVFGKPVDHRSPEAIKAGCKEPVPVGTKSHYSRYGYGYVQYVGSVPGPGDPRYPTTE